MLVTLMLSIAIATGPAPTGNPTEGVSAANCQRCVDIAQMFLWQHYFTGGSCSGGGVDSCFDCAAFNACHGNIQSGTCSSFHYGCGSGGLTVTPGDLEAVERVLAANDADGLALLVVSLRGKVVVNGERQSLQVIGCNGLIIANYPLTNTQAESVLGLAQ